MECPVCGLPLAERRLPKPLLFQASALQARPVQEARRTAISTPALGRVDPVQVAGPADLRPAAAPLLMEHAEPESGGGAFDEEPAAESFWPLVRLEVVEAGLLLLINLGVGLLASWLSGVGPVRLYLELWHFLLPVHFAISWAFEMVPITLVGQSPVMGSLGLLLDSAQPERRIAFSLFHLVSVLLFPVSFFCMVLTPYHQTLAETLTGQEILARPLQRMR